MNKSIISVLLVSLLCIAGAAAGERSDSILRPVLSAYGIEAGTAHIAQTYVSPLRNSGAALALNYERMQAMRHNPRRYVMRLDIGIAGASASNVPAHNKRLWNVGLHARWGMYRRYDTGAWSLYGGAYAGIEGGVQYVPANGNNPVAANAAATIGVSAMAAWHSTLLRRPLTLHWRGLMPLTGAFFAPQYGELYYEIYLGNHSGLARCAWPGNYFQLDNFVGGDLRLGGTALRLGYSLKLKSTKASDIVGRNISHMAVVGVVSEWISLSPGRRPAADAKIISALY